MSVYRPLASIDEFIEHILSDPRFRDSVAAVRNEEDSPGSYADLPAWLAPQLRSVLQKGGISRLYSHQAEALEAINQGTNTIITTGVASGKSLIYQLSILSQMLAMPKARALLLFPTKALAQDQANKLSTMLDFINPQLPPKCRIKMGLYDGDTPASQRQRIRREAQIIFSNPDMLHTAILPNHSLWKDFFAGLHFVVIDELHIYRGVFGSHFALVMRRLKRIARVYGRDLQFVCSSATLANAHELAENMLESTVRLIDSDGSPKGKRSFIILNPPMVNQDLGIRRSALIESSSLSRRFLDSSGQAILFTGARRSVEILYLHLLNKGDWGQQIRSYRSGYLAENRRQIEAELRSGDTRLVVSTNALELGIDIGGLDAVFLNGYPGSICATRQQSGRAGRKGNTALCVMVASAGPLDQYICLHPEYLFEQNPEQALIDPDNPEILQKHLLCAIADMALIEGESFGNLSFKLLEPHLQILLEDGKIIKSGSRYQNAPQSYPAGDFSIRNASGNLQLFSSGELIGYIDAESALWMTHPNAIYLDKGDTWKVDKLDLAEQRVELSPAHVNYYTQATRKTEIELIELLMNSRIPGGIRRFGKVKVTTLITGFKKLRFLTQEILGYEELDLPPSQLETIAWWISLSPELVAKVKEQGLWRNEPNSYGKDWPVICQRIRTRDGFRCAACGALESGKAFDVHHKIPFRNFEDPHLANRDENLVTLCPRCHRLAEANVLIQSGLAGLSYLLVNLAPFFVFCDRKDLDVFFEDKSDLGSGDPVIAIYDKVPGGVGLSAKLYELSEKLLHEALLLVQNCPCTDGCPGCTGPVASNGLGAKEHAIAILKELVKPSHSNLLTVN